VLLPNPPLQRTALRAAAERQYRWADSKMARAPFQVIVFLFVRRPEGEPLYAIFQRRDCPTMWQAVSGGGEDSETPLEAAVRETMEETGITGVDTWIRLDSQASVPASAFSGTDHWPSDVFVVPEYAFGLAVPDTTVQMSPEHREHAWLPFREAQQRLTWDSNKVALWELHCRVRGLSPKQTANPALAAVVEPVPALSESDGDAVGA
jgi:dATP pyrophosphohydrolase